MPAHQPIVDQLLAMLRTRTDLEVALRASIAAAERPGIATLEEYCSFLDGVVTLVPVARSLLNTVNTYYYLIDLSPDDLLRTDPAFLEWTHRFAAEWGSFLDTPASIAAIQGFLVDPSYHLDDYYVAPSGWLTYNQFFARQVRPGRRPVDAWNDDRVVVSAADSVYQGHWPIEADSTIAVKGLVWSVIDLLAGSPYQKAFKGGSFTHSFLNINDYHRFHVPVSGTVLENRTIPGRVSLDVKRMPDGTLQSVDGTGYQFAQERGLIVLDSPLGLVAVLPIGMAQVSSVTMTSEVGAWLAKGQEFGFFQFGGSDIVTLYEAGRVQFDAVVGTHYNQGRRVGYQSL